MKFEMASGCEWEWVATCCKTAKHLHRTVERHADITSVLLERSSSAKLLQDTSRKTNLMSAWDHQGHPKFRQRKIMKQKRNTTTQQNAETKKINYELRWPWTITILRSSDQRGRHPRRAPPWIGHAIRHVCEWTHCIWMAGLKSRGARFISSNDTPPKKAPSSARGGRGRESGRAYRMCERMGGWVMYAWLRAWLAVCETGWELERRRREETKSFNILTRNKIEKRNNVASNKFQESKFCLNRLILISLKKKKKMNFKHETKLSLRNYFCFGLLLSLY